jgi:hypothetical protein
MAKAKKRKSTGGKRRARRSNPSNPRRRRRNPRSGFGDNAMKMGGVALAALAGGALVLVGMSKIMPGQAISTYGVPAAGLLIGAALYKSHPEIGAGVAAGSIAGAFALPLASKTLTMLPASTTPAAQPAATTAAGISAAMRRYNMNAVHMGAVHMGGPQYRYAT